MKTYKIAYFFQTTGMLWWKKTEGVWGLFEEVECDRSDHLDYYPDMRTFDKLIDSDTSLEYIKDLRDKLEQGEDYEV